MKFAIIITNLFIVSLYIAEGANLRLLQELKESIHISLNNNFVKITIQKVT